MRGICGLALAQGEGGCEGFAEFGERDAEASGMGCAGVQSVDEVGGPVEEVAQEGGEIGEKVGDFAVGVFLLAQERQEAVLVRRGVPVQDDLRIDEGGRRDNKASGWR